MKKRILACNMLTDCQTAKAILICFDKVSPSWSPKSCLTLASNSFIALISKFKSLNTKQFLLGFLLLGSLYMVANRNWIKNRWPIQMDANGYYIYLPAIFIYGDLEHLSFVDKMPQQFDRKYFLYPSAQGGYMTKYTPGMAILELPFFLVAHGLSLTFGLEANGYSPPYRLALAFSTIFYTVLGLWLLARMLAQYFKPSPVLWTVALIGGATNLLFYAVIQPGITHNYVFFTLVAAMFFGDKWYRERRWQDFAFSCAAVGFSALIRPTEILVGMIPLGFLLAAWKSEQFKFDAIAKLWKTIFIGGLAFALLLLPIFAYWKFATGNWIAYTYSDEGFYFDRPWQIWLGLFGSRKGWFIYTPLLFLSSAGLWFWRKNESLGHFKAALWAYMPINLYIVLSWYGWWYGGCFGLRALIPALGIMAIPLAALFENFSNKPAALFRIQAIACFFLFLNLFQSFQYQRRVMHFDSMTWPAYWYIFGKTSLNEKQRAELEPLLDHPTYLERGKKLDEYFE